MTTLAWAKKYVNQFKWSVIPVKNKVPQLKSWMEYQTRYPTEQELMKWFLNTDNEIAIVTGQLSQLSVLDVDTRELPKWWLEKGINSRIFVQTPHGYHYYFKYCEGLKNHVKILENVDIRTEGGYCCAPPNPGYTFNRNWFNLSQLRDFPLGLLPKETSQKTRLKGTGRIEELLNGLQYGNRDNTFTSLIGLLNRDGYSQSDIITILSPHAERVKFDGLQDKVEHILNDYPILSKQNTELFESDSLSDFLADIHPVSWICEPILGKGTLAFVGGLPETLKTWICADLAIEVARGGKWLGKFQVNQGKVLFIDQERWRGHTQTRFKRLMNEKQLSAKDLEGNLILKSQTTTRIDLDESYNAFKRKLEDIKPDLVIIDSWSTFHTKNENSRQEIQGVFEKINKLRHLFGCTFLFLDHEGKSVLNQENQPEIPNAFSLTGSIGKPAAIETAFAVRRLNETEVMMYHTKSTIANKINPIKISVRDTSLGVKVEG